MYFFLAIRLTGEETKVEDIPERRIRKGHVALELPRMIRHCRQALHAMIGHAYLLGRAQGIETIFHHTGSKKVAVVIRFVLFVGGTGITDVHHPVSIVFR